MDYLVAITFIQPGSAHQGWSVAQVSCSLVLLSSGLLEFPEDCLYIYICISIYLYLSLYISPHF